MSNKIYIGLMSGTSMDGIDLSAISISSQEHITEISNSYLPYDSTFKATARRAEQIVQLSKGDRSSESDFLKAFEQELTYLHIQAVRDFLEKNNLKAQDIEAIGFHGQTLFHNPADKITIQFGDGELMAKELKIKVVYDFRSGDVANGGQGAPLVPIFHFALAKQQKLLPLAIINCGGISNITIIPSESEFDIIGFDTGPGNVLIDRYLREKTAGGEFYDLDGKYGSKGIAQPDMLGLLYQESIKQDSYFTKKPPKSLCSSDFYIPNEIFDLSIYDACRTLEVFTAQTIFTQLPNIQNVILVGGGWHNPIITETFKYIVSKRNPGVCFLDPISLGWNLDSMEAGAFAYFAHRHMHKLPISFPNTTAVSKPFVCGRLTEV
jgi:anhydro-N-acetylmuramic acid kinase